MVEYIIHPTSREKILLNSKKGQNLLKNYKKNYLKTGGFLEPSTNLTQKLIEINDKRKNNKKMVEDDIHDYQEAFQNKKPILLDKYHHDILKWPNNDKYQQLVKRDALLTITLLGKELESRPIDKTNDSIISL